MINQISQVIKFRSSKRSLPWGAVLFFVLSASLLAVILFAILGYQILYLNRVYPGVSISGVRVDGMTYPELITAINTQTVDDLSRPITIQAGDKRWSFTAQELGLRVDARATADQAYQIGRRGHLFVDMFTHLSMIFTSRNIEPVFLFDTGVTAQSLQVIRDVIDRPPREAQLVIHSAAEVELIPAQLGRRLHVNGSLPLIEAAVLNDDKQAVVAITQQIIPAKTDEVVEPVYQQLKHLLSRSLIFKFATDTDAGEWELEPATVVNLLNIVESSDADGKPKLELEPNKDKVMAHLDKFATAIQQPAVDAQLKFNEETQELIVLRPSQNGRRLDPEAAYERTVAAVTGGAHVIELPVLVVRPAIPSDDLESLGIETLVSEATSYFTGSSEGRMHNIALAASKFDGVVIPPGQIFSFNRHLGEVNAETGYDESLVIFGDRTAVGIGGGICQVSTTAFRSAFFGGFEIVERWAHGYRVGWYEINSSVGLDASIYTPDVDFKFRNDTDHYLLIQTHTDKKAGTLTFKFFGTPANREIIVSEPEITNVVKHGPPIYEEDPDLPDGFIKQVDWANDGMEVSVTRVVKEGDKVIHRDEIFSRYRPWQAVYKVGSRN
jgi:vancomycin resistance protein YoaR